MMGSVGGPDDVSILEIAESISNQETASFTASRPTKKSPKLLRDHMHAPSKRLQIKSLSCRSDVFGRSSDQRDWKRYSRHQKPNGTKEQQFKYVRDVIMTKVKRYLRPPDENDKW